MKKYTTLLIGVGVVLLGSFSSAQALTTGSNDSCVSLSNNLQLGSRDAFTNGEVTALQNFLVKQGMLAVAPTGYFGTATFRAVKMFQSESGVSSVGAVGPLTRAKIKALTCAEVSANTPAPADVSPVVTTTPPASQTPVTPVAVPEVVNNQSVPQVTNVTPPAPVQQTQSPAPAPAQTQPSPVQQTVPTPTVAAVDTIAPSVPTGVIVSAASQTQLNVKWTASTDNVGVTGYRVFRNGVQVATTAVTSYGDGGLLSANAYSYTIVAFDAAGNKSGASVSASGTTYAATVQSSSGVYQILLNGGVLMRVTNSPLTRDNAIKNCKLTHTYYPTKTISCSLSGEVVYSAGPITAQ